MSYHPYQPYHYEGFIPYGDVRLVDHKLGMQERAAQNERLPKVPHTVEKKMKTSQMQKGSKYIASEDTAESNVQNNNSQEIDSSSSFESYNSRAGSVIFHLKNETSLQKLGQISKNYLYVPPSKSSPNKQQQETSSSSPNKQQQETSSSSPNKPTTSPSKTNGSPKVTFVSTYMASFHSCDEKDKKFNEQKKDFLEESAFSQSVFGAQNLSATKPQITRKEDGLGFFSPKKESTFISTNQHDFGKRGYNPTDRYGSILHEEKSKPAFSSPLSNITAKQLKNISELRNISTTRDLVLGTSLGTNSRMSGYGGHIPSEPDNLAKMHDNQLDLTKLHAKDCMKNSIRTRLPKYMGFQPQSLKNEFNFHPDPQSTLKSSPTEYLDEFCAAKNRAPRLRPTRDFDRTKKVIYDFFTVESGEKGGAGIASAERFFQ